MKGRDIRILVVATLATTLLSTVALLDFYAANATRLTSAMRVIHYAAGILAIVALITGAIKLVARHIPLWRILLATGLAAFTFFSYNGILGLLKATNVHFGTWFTLTWLGVTFAVGILALIFLRHPRAVSVLLVLSLAFAAPSASRIATLPPNTDPIPTMSIVGDGSIASARISPNIYWIVLDAYPRQDVLKQDFGFDNSDFLNSLTSLDFVVLDRTRSNFPATINSISSTLNMDYTVEEKDGRLRPWPMASLYPIVKGKSRTVAHLTALGYHYVHFENGYDYLTKCADDEPRCIHGNAWLDELDSGILANTPIMDLVLYWGRSHGERSTAFAWGGVADLTSRLDLVRETRAPFFLYAHIMAPHVPIRFHRDCSYWPSTLDLQRWTPSARPAFVEQLTCINRQTLTLMRSILEADNTALIILQSDHGSAFNGQFEKPATEWSDADLHERFGALNAMRLPAPCRTLAAPDLTLVDTFPLVFACLTGSDFTRHSPPRFFVTPYDDSAEFGQAIEYPIEQVR